MNIPARLAVFLALPTFALLGMAGPARAVRGSPPQQHESLQDQMRCDALAKQFHTTASQRPANDAAQEQASQGEVLCRAGRYSEGADTLEKAVRMISDKPSR